MRLEDNISKGPFKTIQGNLFVTGDISDVYSKEQFDSQFTTLEDALQAQEMLPYQLQPHHKMVMQFKGVMVEQME